MKTFAVVIASLLTLAGCGSFAAEEPMNMHVHADEATPSLRERAGQADHRQFDLQVTRDAGPCDTSAPDATVRCMPTVGHCVTHMNTLCYETSFDDRDACAVSGQATGWAAGPCDATRSSGGCQLGCRVSYSYPLGGKQPTFETAAGARSQCEAVDGVFVPTLIEVPANSF